MDKIEARKNLELLNQDKQKLQSLNHLNSTYAFKDACLCRIRQIDEQIKNIKSGLK